MQHILKKVTFSELCIFSAYVVYLYTPMYINNNYAKAGLPPECTHDAQHI